METVFSEDASVSFGFVSSEGDDALSCGFSFCVVLLFSPSGVIGTAVCKAADDEASSDSFSDGDLHITITRTTTAISKRKDMHVIKFDFFIDFYLSESEI